MRRILSGAVLTALLGYTAWAVWPYVWTALMSLRTTEEILRDYYGLPIPAHWDKFGEAWTRFGFGIYLRNSILVTLGDRKSTRLNSSHSRASRMPSSA